MAAGCIFYGMKKLNEVEKIAVKRRLEKLAADTEHSEGRASHGRYADIKRFFEAKGEKVSNQSIGKWFSGRSVPSVPSAKLLADYFGRGTTYLWILYGEGHMGIVGEDGTQRQVPVFLIPLLTPDQLRDWQNGTLTEPVTSREEVFADFGPGAFAFAINDNSVLPLAAKGMKAVVEPEAPEMLDLVSSGRCFVIMDRGQFLVGDYSTTPYPTLTPPNRDFRPIELSDKHAVVGVLSALTQYKFR